MVDDFSPVDLGDSLSQDDALPRCSILYDRSKDFALLVG